MKRVVRAAALAVVVLAAGVSAQAALVKYRMTGAVTQSWTFDDGSTVPEGTPVTVSYTYDTRQASESMLRNEDGSGTATYKIDRPYHFKLVAGAHRARVTSFRVTLNNDLIQPFGDTYDVEDADGAAIDGVWQPDAKLSISLLSVAGNTEALRSLKLPRHLDAWSFDAFRVGNLWKDPDHPLLTFTIFDITSTVCLVPVPGTDDCAVPVPH